MSLKIKAKRNEKERSSGVLKRLTEHLKELQKQKIEVGYFDGEEHPTAGMPFATLMAIHEHGQSDKNIPSRPIFQIAHEELRPKRNSHTRALVKDVVVQVGRLPQSLGSVGEHYKDGIKSIFGDTSKLASNTPAVQAAKGGDTPMIETTALRDNLGYRINGEEVKK